MYAGVCNVPLLAELKAGRIVELPNTVFQRDSDAGWMQAQSVHSHC